VISEQVNTLTSEYAQAKAERIRLETRLNALRGLRTSSLSESSFPTVLQDTTIQGLRKQRNDVEVELAEKLRTLKEGHPQIKELRSRLAGVDARLREEMDTIRRSLETDFAMASQREQSLFNNIQLLKSESIELSKQTLEYDRLKRDYEQNKAFLEDMLARSKEADISSSASLNNLRVIEPAVPAERPFSPNVPRTVAMGLVLGLFLGVGLVVGMDFLDQSLRAPDHVERHTGLEVLSVLPKFTEESASALRESFQSLRTALLLASRGEGCQVLLVTSAVPGEGKTTVVFNLGKVLAAAGARVLLIDGDLRKPRLHRMINVKNVRGLTSVVLGERDLGEVIHALADIPNMDLVTSGPLPPNPPELYGKASFARLLALAREQYDWVILDCPPVASVTDPVVASLQVDMAVMVVEYGKARRQLIRDCVRQLGRTGVRIAGVLFNKVDVDRDHYYYTYYYSHYYRYGYGETEPAAAKGKTKAAEARGA
jgi:capsular exopolysaccharide synthesis family protein